MILIECPNCGKRNQSEYKYGGEYNPRPEKPLETSDQEWSDYIYMRDNKCGVQKEWWYHRQGCGKWFLAERHTKTHVVEATYEWSKS